MCPCYSRDNVPGSPESAQLSFLQDLPAGQSLREGHSGNTQESTPRPDGTACAAVGQVSQHHSRQENHTPSTRAPCGPRTEPPQEETGTWAGYRTTSRIPDHF